MINRRFSRMSLAPALLAVLLFAVFVTACSTVENPADILEKSQEAMADLQSYRFGGEILEIDETGERSVVQSGEWISPDRFHLKMEGDGQIDELIVIGLQAYVYDSDYPERGWPEQPLLGAGIPVPNFEYLEDLNNLRLIKGELSIDGIPVYRIVGKLPRDEERARRTEEHLTQDDPYRQEKLVSIARWNTSVELFVSKNDHRVLRIVHSLYMEDWETSTDTTGVKTFSSIPIEQVTVTSYSDFNSSITIEAPE